jgi:hypothetical protein
MLLLLLPLFTLLLLALIRRGSSRSYALAQNSATRASWLLLLPPLLVPIVSAWAAA